MSSKKASAPLQASHVLEFAVDVVARDAGGIVTSCRCKFRVFDGRDKVDLRAHAKRKRKERYDIKYLVVPFLCHKYRSHHATQHNKDAWDAYQSLSLMEKESHFDGRVSVMNTLHWHLDGQIDILTLKMNARIADTIIGDLFFPDDEVLPDADVSDDDADPLGVVQKSMGRREKDKENAMRLFVKNASTPDMHVVVVKNTTRFQLIVDHVSTGMSL